MRSRGASSSAAWPRPVAQAGLRAKLAKSVMDCGEGLPPVWQRTAQEELDQQEADLKRFHNTAEGRVQVWFGLRTIFNNSDSLIQRTKELADRYGVGVHMHVAEAREEVAYCQEVFGEPTVTHLERLGVLDQNLLAVHTVWLTNEEVELFRKRDVKVSHNPASAMRVLGFAKIPRMLREGICVSLGTVGASSINRMDMVDRDVAYLPHPQMGWRLDQRWYPPRPFCRWPPSTGPGPVGRPPVPAAWSRAKRPI